MRETVLSLAILIAVFGSVDRGNSATIQFMEDDEPMVVNHTVKAVPYRVDGEWQWQYVVTGIAFSRLGLEQCMDKMGEVIMCDEREENLFILEDIAPITSALISNTVTQAVRGGVEGLKPLFPNTPTLIIKDCCECPPTVSPVEPPAPVPLPASAVLLGMSLAICSLFKRRKK